MDDRVKVGMAVLDQDGRTLGRVARLHPWGFEVVRGFWSPREWVIRWDEVLDVGEAGARVARSARELFDLAEGGLPPWWNRRTPKLVAPSPRPPGGYAAAGAPAPGLGVGGGE